MHVKSCVSKAAEGRSGGDIERSGRAGARRSDFLQSSPTGCLSVTVNADATPLG